MPRREADHRQRLGVLQAHVAGKSLQVRLDNGQSLTNVLAANVYGRDLWLGQPNPELEDATSVTEAARDGNMTDAARIGRLCRRHA